MPVFPWQNEQIFVNGAGVVWPRNILIADGFDPYGYIATANLAFYPYTTQQLIQTRLGGLIKLIEACDDNDPPSGDFTDKTVLANYNATLQSVTNEINGYLQTAYPIPFMQTGTVAIFQVTGVSTDGNGTVTTIQPILGANGNCGNYAVAPSTSQTPVYLQFLAPQANSNCWGNWYECGDWWTCQTGTGLALTVAYSSSPTTLGGGATQLVYSVNGTPTITNGGTGYNCGDIVILTGGASFVPAKIQEAMLQLCCHDFYQRRITGDEQNPFKLQATKWRGDSDDDGLLQKIGEGDWSLDGTFKRYYAAAPSWGRVSALQGGTT